MRDIHDRLIEISFNSTFWLELSAIGLLLKFVDEGLLDRARFGRIHFHVIEAHAEFDKIALSTKRNNCGRNADERRAVRQDRSRPIIDGLEPWLRAKLALISQKTKLAEAIRYALSRRNGLTHFLDDGRIEINSNAVERSIRPIALNRKNALFAGSDGGAEHWAVVASLIESCKRNAIDPQAYLTDVITKIVNGHPNSRIDELLPWAYALNQPLKDVA